MVNGILLSGREDAACCGLQAKPTPSTMSVGMSFASSSGVKNIESWQFR